MKIVTGNLLEAVETYIGHGTNCQGVMGSGVAFAIKEKWPVVFEDYLTLCEDEVETWGDRRVLLGTCQLVGISDEQTVVNMFTQLSFGGGKQAGYAAVANSIKYFLNYYLSIIENPDRVVNLAIPYKFASDRGGLDWDVVKEIFEEYEELYRGQFFVTAYKLPEIDNKV